MPNATVAGILTRRVNLLPATSAILAETSVGALSGIQSLRTNSDLFFGLAANLNESVTVGSIPGVTPWRAALAHTAKVHPGDSVAVAILSNLMATA